MNDAQSLWWQQARSDLELFNLLRKKGQHECHLLHYLQMATEKISKAYFWRTGKAPPRSHTGLVRFLKALLDRSSNDLDQIAQALEFGRPLDLFNWVKSVRGMAYDLQNIAPAESGNGPNPEYPWPHENPTHYPAGHDFVLWKNLVNTAQGRKLILFIDRAISRFEIYA